jgi:O-antigen ligase
LGACAAVLIFAARQGPSWLSIGAATACAAVIPLTLSRSGLGLFVVTLLLAVVVAFNHRRAAAIALVALLVFVASTAGNPDTRLRAEAAVASIVTTVVGQQSSDGVPKTRPVPNAVDDNRRYLIAAGLKMFTDHPVVGVGFGAFQHELLTTYRNFLPASRNGPNLDSLSHASLVTVLAEQGLAGGLVLTAFLILLGREAWVARRRLDQMALWSTIPATLIIPIFLYSQVEGRLFGEPYLWVALGLMYSAQSAAMGKETARQKQKLTRVA